VKDKISKAAPVQPIPKKAGLLPSWNLSTSRLHFLSTVTNVSVEIESVTLNQSVMDLGVDQQRRPRVVLKSRSSASATASGRSSDAVSYFVSFAIPPSTAANNYCSRKVSGNEVAFRQRFVQAVTFKPALLDAWWTSDLEFKVSSRSMKQRVPTPIGEASIGLKYLLTDAKNSDGSVLKLPIYAGQKFLSEHRPASEIVGDLRVSFLLSPGPSSRGGASYRPVSPQRAVRDGESESSEEPHKADRYAFMTADREVEAEKTLPPKAILTSRGHKERDLLTSRAVLQERSAVSSGQQPQDIFCLLKVTEGRNFSLDSTKQTSLFLTTRFLNSTDVVKSQVCWNSTRPLFSLMHYVPVRLDSEFLQRCQNNFLVS
jgi:hypothetical protein